MDLAAATGAEDRPSWRTRVPEAPAIDCPPRAGTGYGATEAAPVIADASQGLLQRVDHGVAAAIAEDQPSGRRVLCHRCDHRTGTTARIARLHAVHPNKGAKSPGVVGFREPGCGPG